MLPNLLEAGPPPVALADLIDTLKTAWRQGTPPDTAAALRDHPELLQRSVVVDLAFEEYCLWEEADRTPEVEEFCERLPPEFRSQVREVLRDYRLLAQHAHLLDAPAEVNWPRAGEQFEGLAIVRELGRGAFARVYLARDPNAGNRPVALKLSPAPSGEAHTLGPINHPHIGGVHWAKRVKGLSAICMPYVGAATLRDAIDATFARSAAHSDPVRAVLDLLGRCGDPAPQTPAAARPVLAGRQTYPEAVAAIAARLADALAHLHAARIAHGDLKPSNVLLGPGGHPYLIDFNLATGQGDSPLRCGGTLPYMAPERVRVLAGQTTAPGSDRPADVYSFGVVLFEALTGRLPFTPGDPLDPKRAAADLLGRQLAGPPAFPAAAGVPAVLARVVRRCLAVDPRQRPTAEQLKRLLDLHARQVRRKRAALAAVGVFLLAGLAVLSSLGWQAARGSQAGPERRDSDTDAQGPGRGMPTALTSAPPTPVPAEPKAKPKAVEKDPSTADEFFARGVRRLKAGEKREAARPDFAEANRLRPDGRTWAYLAYCTTSPQNVEAAAACYETAIDKGYGPAWVHNNRADSLILFALSISGSQRPKAHAHLRLAIDEATAAVESDRNLRAAYYNRALARYLLNLDETTEILDDPGGLCIADVERVIALEGPSNADLYYEAAQILVATDPNRPAFRDRAIRYLNKAVDLGKRPQAIAGDPVLKMHLAYDADFRQVITRPAEALPKSPTPNLRLVAPPDL
jgi:hypothetical protein